MALDHQAGGFHHLEDGLMELGLGRVLGLDQGDDLFSVVVHVYLPRDPASLPCILCAGLYLNKRS